MVIRPIQDLLLESFDKILAFNGIALKLFFKTLQPLEFVDLENAQTQEQVAEETGTELSSQILDKFGEEINPEWILIDEHEVNYDTDDKSRNNTLVTLLTAGEGLHNNHHGKPGDPKFSLNKNEVDITWYFIKMIGAKNDRH